MIIVSFSHTNLNRRFPRCVLFKNYKIKLPYIIIMMRCVKRELTLLPHALPPTANC